MKKLFAALLVVMMFLMSVIPAFAAETGTGTITINDITDGAVYEVYRLLDLKSYNDQTGAYSYQVNSAWSTFFATDEAQQYVNVEDGYVTWKVSEDDAVVATFAKLALEYAKTKNISPVKSSNTEGHMEKGTDDETKKPYGKFSKLELGWYLVDSSVGVLCGLTTTAPDASITVKNGAPTIRKEVQEDSDNQWGDKNSADIGQTVNFRVTIDVNKGAQDYVLHDMMSAGLTFDKVGKIELLKKGAASGTTATVNTDYTIWTATGITESTEDDVTDTCTMEVRFSEDFCDSLEEGDTLVVYYQAVLNNNAVIAGEGNLNEAWLEYGESNYTTHETTHYITHTYTYAFDLVKTDNQDVLLSGAKFKIFYAATGDNEVPVVLVSEGVYRVAVKGETGVEINVTNGKVRIFGLDSDTYYLEETQAPQGYNRLTARQMFEIENTNLDASLENGAYAEGGVKVVNKTGSRLPITGGLGSTLFVMLGGIAVLGAGVLLFVKKRMAQIAE